MKRLYIFILFLLSLFCIPQALAQTKMKIGVLELKDGTGVDKASVRGLEDMLISHLQSTGKFSIVERSRVNDLVKELRITQGVNPTKAQLSAFSKRLGVNAILLGTVNYISGSREYDLDIRLVSVTDGSTLAASGVTQNQRETKRQLMKRISLDLANQIASTTAQPVLLHGYLTVYPYDIGEFAEKPTEILRMINKKAEYGYTDWRLPTEQELALMKANRVALGIVPDNRYATSSSHFGGYEYILRPVRSEKEAISEGQVVLLPERYDFGKIPTLKTLNETTFDIKNNTTSVVKIESITCSMSNVTAVGSSTSIAPGCTSTVHVVLNTKGRQGISIIRNIDIVLSNGQTLTFVLTGQVK